MLVERKSPITGTVARMDLPVTKEQLQRWREGELIQQAMPHLTAAQREFLISGVTPDQWAAAFGPEDS